MEELRIEQLIMQSVEQGDKEVTLDYLYSNDIDDDENSDINYIDEFNATILMHFYYYNLGLEVISTLINLGILGL